MGATFTLPADNSQQKLYDRVLIMELLIPGLILVALMVYASTKIKKSAAQAYDEELIENQEFRLVKPEGFINPVDASGDAVLTAYTRDFGIDEAADIRLVSANIYAFSDKDISARRTELFDELGSAAERSFQINRFPAMLIEGTSAVNGAKILSKIKLIQGIPTLYELRADTIEDAVDDFSKAVEKMIASFEVK